MNRISRREYLFATHVPLKNEIVRYTTREIANMIGINLVEGYRIGARLCRKGIVKKDHDFEAYYLTPRGYDWCLQVYPRIWRQTSDE